MLLAFSNIFSSETTGPNFIWSLLGTGKWKFVKTVQVTWPRWSPCQYMVKTLKIFFSRTKRLMTLKFGMQHQMHEYYQVYANYVPGLTMTYFKARSNLLPYAFVWEKGKTMDFSETVVVYDFKLAADDRNDKKFLLALKLCPLEAVCSLPRRLLRHFLKLATNERSDKTFYWHQNFVHLGLSDPALGLYTCIKSLKNLYKIRL